MEFRRQEEPRFAASLDGVSPTTLGSDDRGRQRAARGGGSRFPGPAARNPPRAAFGRRPGPSGHLRDVARRTDRRRAVRRPLPPDQRGFGVPHRDGAPRELAAAAHGGRLRRVHRAAPRHSPLLRGAHRPHAARHGTRNDRAPGGPRGVRGHHREPRGRRPGGKRLLRALRFVPRADPGGRAGPAASRGSGGDPQRSGGRVPDVSRLLRGRIPSGSPHHHRRLRAAERARVLRVPHRPLHHPRSDRRGSPPDRPRRGGAHPGRNGRGDARHRFRGDFRSSSSTSCAPIPASTWTPPKRCCGRRCGS